MSAESVTPTESSAVVTPTETVPTEPVPAVPTEEAEKVISSVTAVREHVRKTWGGLIQVVASAQNGTSLFVQTCTPGEKGHILTMVFLAHNHGVYMSHSDHKEGVYERLKHEDEGKIFFIANDENRLLGNDEFGKESGVKVWTTPNRAPNGDVIYLPIVWETGDTPPVGAQPPAQPPAQPVEETEATEEA